MKILLDGEKQEYTSFCSLKSFLLFFPASRGYTQGARTHHHEFPAPDATALSFSRADFPAGLRPQMTLDQRGMRLQVAPVF